MNDDNLKTFTTFCVAIGWVGIVLYPGVLAANAMLLASTAKLPGKLDCARIYFLLGSTLYPLVFLIMNAWSSDARDDDEFRSALHRSLVPIYYLLSLGVAGGIMFYAEATKASA